MTAGNGIMEDRNMSDASEYATIQAIQRQLKLANVMEALGLTSELNGKIFWALAVSRRP